MYIKYRDNNWGRKNFRYGRGVSGKETPNDLFNDLIPKFSIFNEKKQEPFL
jgi:hypothetical protein